MRCEVTGVPGVLLTLLTAETHRQNPVTRIISSLPQYAAQFSIVIQSRFCFMQKKVKSAKPEVPQICSRMELAEIQNCTINTSPHSHSPDIIILFWQFWFCLYAASIQLAAFQLCTMNRAWPRKKCYQCSYGILVAIITLPHTTINKE